MDALETEQRTIASRERPPTIGDALNVIALAAQALANPSLSATDEETDSR